MKDVSLARPPFRRRVLMAGLLALLSALLLTPSFGAVAGDETAKAAPLPGGNPSFGARVSTGLVAFYSFTEPGGVVARDTSGAGAPLALNCNANVSFIPGRNGVRIADGGQLESSAATKISQALQSTGEFSFEIWAKADNTSQNGPARLLTVSDGAATRNFTLGPEGGDMHVRLRTTGTSLNGAPDMVQSGSVTTAEEHYVVTYDGSVLAFYHNGQLLSSEARSGDLSGWDMDYPLLVGNEMGADRQWMGEVYLVAVFDRALNEAEIGRNFGTGSNPATPGTVGNNPPVVDLGSDVTILWPANSAMLNVSITDDGLPNNTITPRWATISGPGSVAVRPVTSDQWMAVVPAEGTYVLRLVVSDGAVTASDDVTIRATSSSRVQDGLVAYYPLNEGVGRLALDQSGSSALHLNVLGDVRWLDGKNGVHVDRSGKLISGPGTALVNSLKATNQFSIEIWAKPDNLTQSGPARMITNSTDSNQVNFMLGQDRENIKVRVRTSQGQNSGYPELKASKVVVNQPEHWVVTFDGSQLRLYCDGLLEKSEARTGDLSNWDTALPLVLGNEARSERPFRGDIYMAALYDRPLSEFEIDRNYRVGADLSGGGVVVPNSAPTPNAGADQTVILPTLNALLNGAVVDDGLPGTGITSQWSVVTKPNGSTVTFADPNLLGTAVDFSEGGVYVLRLTSNDGELTATDDITITVTSSLRVTNGLLAFYPLSEGAGTVAADQSGVGAPVHLDLNDKVSWIAGRNGVTIAKDGALLAATAPKLHQAITTNNTFTFELWAKPEITNQFGPARMFTYSGGTDVRNFTLGQQGTRVEVRLRTDRNGADNGWPYLRVDELLDTTTQHYVVSFDGDYLRLYRNGVLVREEFREDDLANWDPAYALAIGNEATIDRPWRGEVYAAAVYDRPLNELEVLRNFNVGDNLSGGGNPISNLAPRPNAGPDRSIVLPATSTTLSSQLIDDGLPTGTVTVSWQQISGPGTATFDDASAAMTGVSFDTPGVYNLRLTADDGELQGTDDVRVTVSENDRVTRGLIAYYPFLESDGRIAHDNSNFGDPLDLDLAGEVNWYSGQNGVRVNGNGRMLSGVATKIYDAIQTSGEFSFEMWAIPQNQDQGGPARMMSYGIDTSNRNFMIGQQQKQFVTRLRTTGSNNNGSPDIKLSDRVGIRRDHWIITYDGRHLRIYKNSQLLATELREGDISNWDPTYQLAIANEVTFNRRWQGDIFLAAIYDRALNEPEIERNRLVGANLSNGGLPVANVAPRLILGPERTITLPDASQSFTPTVIDDGLPFDTITAQWSVQSGPGPVSFSNDTAVNTTASFTVAGTYILRLVVRDGALGAAQDVTVNVIDGAIPRLLDQATWGATPELIQTVSNIGPANWIDSQMGATPSLYDDPSNDSFSHVRARFFYNAMNRPDQLRQRVAFVLSQITVVSANQVGSQKQMVPWIRLMHSSAFGNYYDHLRAVTLSPTMGKYLDMVNNAKAVAGTNIKPNENYARELLQLFGLGLYQRRLDGSIINGSDGMPLSAYTEEDILEFTRALTGWTYPNKPGKSIKWPNPEHYDGPMIPFEGEHDTGEKVFLGLTMPAGQTATQDLDMALRHMFNQSSVAPFISRQLILHLVTSNPSPAYIARVSTVFNDNGSGVKGDMRAVIRAILLDPEAQSPGPNGGHLREPVLYTLNLFRHLGATVGADNRISSDTEVMGQNLFAPPSVFNYFSPDYMIPETGLFGPEFQIHTASKTFARANYAYDVTRGDPGRNVELSLQPFVVAAQDPNFLADMINERMFQFRMSDKLRQTIIDATLAESSQEVRARNALYIAATSSEYQVQH